MPPTDKKLLLAVLKMVHSNLESTTTFCSEAFASQPLIEAVKNAERAAVAALAVAKRETTGD